MIGYFKKGWCKLKIVYFSKKILLPVSLFDGYQFWGRYPMSVLRRNSKKAVFTEALLCKCLPIKKCHAKVCQYFKLKRLFPSVCISKQFFAIGLTTEKAMVEHGLKISGVADKPSPESLLQCITNSLSEGSVTWHEHQTCNEKMCRVRETWLSPFFPSPVCDHGILTMDSGPSVNKFMWIKVYITLKTVCKTLQIVYDLVSLGPCSELVMLPPWYVSRNCKGFVKSFEKKTRWRYLTFTYIKKH